MQSQACNFLTLLVKKVDISQSLFALFQDKVKFHSLDLFFCPDERWLGEVEGLAAFLFLCLRFAEYELEAGASLVCTGGVSDFA